MKVTYNSISAPKILEKSGTIPYFDKHIRKLEVTKDYWFKKTTVEFHTIFQGSREAIWRYTATNKYVEDNDQVEALILKESIDKVLEEHGRSEQSLSTMS